jgi:HNH endonuclease
MHHPIKDNLHLIDWSLSNGEIARRWGGSLGMVVYWRRETGHQAHPPTPKNPVIETVDWTMSVKDIVKTYGLSFWTARKWKRRILKGKKRFSRNLRARVQRERLGDCCICGYNQPVSKHIHHIKPTRLGGTNTPDNLVRLCPNCHAEAHAGLITEERLRAVCLAALAL